MTSLLRKFIALIPVSIGSSLASFPFRYRLGSTYTYYKSIITHPETIQNNFQRIKQLVVICEAHVPFYQDFYRIHKFHSSHLKTVEDLALIPVLTKADLQKYDFKMRVVDTSKGIITNTGGTSGQPLKLLIDKQAYAREWAHMHTIWETLGYKTSSLKLTLRGKNLGNKPLNYNFIHNDFEVNAYCEFLLVVAEINKTVKKYTIEYLHGYPSAIYEFVKQLSQVDPNLLTLLKSNLKGVFFGSEYPAPIYRDYIESVLNIPTVSWYGHSEMAVLAPERDESYVYYPFQSYGFTEAVELNGQQHLVGTTIHNTIGPLIRYDTGDIIEPISYKDGLLESFKISEGRVGEFVTDKNGRNISLTALIFGRHHHIFEFADFIQVKQLEPGQLTVFVTSQNLALRCDELFDSVGIEMDINFKTLTHPFKTKAGKVPLIVN